MKVQKPKKKVPLRQLHKVKLSKDLMWLWPYLEAVEDIVPLDKMNEIRMVKFRDGALPDHDALIENLGRKGFKITVRPYDPAHKRHPISKLDQDTIMQNLCHELSHMVVWEEHDPDRFVAQAAIMVKFANKLKQLGYEKDRNKVLKGNK